MVVNVKSEKRGIEWRFCSLFRMVFEKERESSHGQMDPATKASVEMLLFKPFEFETALDAGEFQHNCIEGKGKKTLPDGSWFEVLRMLRMLPCLMTTSIATGTVSR